MEFRRATIDDKTRILEICSTIWDGFDYIPMIYDKWVADTVGEFTVIIEDGQIMGTGKFTMVAPGIGWMEGLRVAPEARSRGYAREITKYYIQKGRELGLNKLQLSTYYENHASIHVTESYGFQRIANFYLAEKELKPEETTAVEGIRQAKVDSPDYAAVLNALVSAPEPKAQKNFLGYGWLFKTMSEAEAQDAIARGDVYYLKEDGKVRGALVGYPDNVKDRVYYVVLVTGSDCAIKQLLKWAEFKALEYDFTHICSMVPEIPHLKELFFEQGYSHWNNMREENVYIYELGLKGDE